LNGALDVSGTALVTGVLTTTAATVSNGGGQFNGAINVGVDDTGYDVKFFGATAGAYMLWDESADDLILGGAAGLSVNSTALVTGVLTTTAATVHTGGITMPDNAKAIFGAGSDLQIYHDGIDSVIKDAGTGSLEIHAENFEVWDSSKTNVIMAGISSDGEARLYYGGSMKLNTSSTGIDVTGTVTATGTSVFASLDISGDIDVDGTANLDVVDIDGAVDMASTLLVTGVLTTTAATVFNGGFAANAASTIATTDNSVNLTLTSTDDDASGGPQMNFYRNSASPAAGDVLTQIGHLGKNDAGETVAYMYQNWRAAAVGDGVESGQFDINTYSAGSAYERLGIDPTETVFNQDHADLDFRVESDTKTHAFFVDGDNTSNRLKIGMGTGTISNPYSQNNFTDVNIDGVWGGVISFKVGGTETGFAGQRSSGNGGMAVGASSGHELHIISNGVLAQHIDTSGNIIIANTGGTLRTTTAGTSNFRAGVNAGNSIASGGNYNVCIGDEAGTTISTGDQNTAVGYAALNVATGNLNTAVGASAGAAITNGTENTIVGAVAADALQEGQENVVVGYNALGADTTGSRNVAVGQGALSVQDMTGSSVVLSYNTAVGFQSGSLLSTATQNTHVGAKSAGSGVVTGTRNNTFGYLAGENLTSGTNNVFMGSYSGKAFTTGVSNTICGEAALITEAAGDKNTAIGAEALKVQTGGIDGNVAVGYYAGFALTSGSYNTIIGTEAMSLNAITGEQNVAVGYRAGKNITTGAGNVLIGKYAGADTTLLTTGNQNIVIGPFARTSSASVSNEIVIGYNVPGSGEGYAVIGNGNGKIAVDFEANATWSYSSDERLKKDIVADDLGLSFINRLETVKYKWKPSNEIDESLPQYAEENTRKTNVVMHGMVAQTVKAALDAENVDTFAGWSTDLDGTQMVSREMFVTPLIKAVQELSAKNDALEARIAVLEG
jgi:hypothetical protein